MEGEGKDLFAGRYEHIMKEFTEYISKYGRTYRGKPSYSVFMNLVARRSGTTLIEGVFGSPFSIYRLGIGKSVYCLKTLMWIYNHSWEDAKKNIFFEPMQLLKRMEQAIDRGERIPAVLWDDAGFWINAYEWQTKLARTMKKYINVIRLCTVHLMITAPTPKEVMKGVREQMGLIQLIRPYQNFDSEDPRKRKSVASTLFGEDHYMLWLKGRVSAPIHYYFYLYFPFYDDYAKMRSDITRRGTEIVVEEFKKEVEEVSKKVEGAKMDEPEYEPEDVEDVEE